MRISSKYFPMQDTSPEEKIESYTDMSKFRNRIVHLYNHIDTETLYKILTDEFDDIKDFYKNLLEIIETHMELRINRRAIIQQA